MISKRVVAAMAWLCIFLKSVAAGAMIAIGSALYINIPSKVLGAFMFSIGLVAILSQKYMLFTGVVGDKWTTTSPILFPLIFVGNGIGTILCRLFGGAGAAELWASKMDKPLLTVLWQGIICGILIYVAVAAYKRDEVHAIPIVVMAVAAFILVGGEHCIADMAYMFAADSFCWESMKTILFAAIGNIIGAKLMGIRWGASLVVKLYED